MAAPSLDALKKELDRAIKAGDPEKIAGAWRAIAEAHPESADGGDASYRLGLDSLFRGRNLDDAEKYLRMAVKIKGAHALPARNALGLVLLRQGKAQQGTFELRKVAGVTPPTLLTASAWGLLVVAFKEAGNMKEAERAHTEHKRALDKLTQSKTPEESAVAHYMLAMEYKIDGERALAKRHLETAISSNKLPASDLENAKKALSEV